MYVSMVKGKRNCVKKIRETIKTDLLILTNTLQVTYFTHWSAHLFFSDEQKNVLTVYHSGLTMESVRNYKYLV